MAGDLETSGDGRRETTKRKSKRTLMATIFIDRVIFSPHEASSTNGELLMEVPHEVEKRGAEGEIWAYRSRK